MTSAERNLLELVMSNGKAESVAAAKCAVAEERCPPEFFEQCVGAQERRAAASAVWESCCGQMRDLGLLGPTNGEFYDKVIAAAEERQKQRGIFR